MAMRIYFAGSIRAGREDASLYAKIISLLQSYGTVLTEHVGNPEIVDSGLTDKQIHDRDVEWLKSADVVVAEVTRPSLGVGYEIGRAVAMEKKILCLFRPDSTKRLSAMVRGKSSIQVEDYTEEQVEAILHRYFSSS